MNWLDLIQKLLSITVNILKLHEYYPGFKQWLRDININWQNFWHRVNQLLKYLAIAGTASLVVLLLSAGIEFLIRNYSPDMPASAFVDLGQKTLGGVAVGGLAIKGFWHCAIKMASL